MAEHKPFALWVTNPGKYDFWYGMIVKSASADPVMIPWDYTPKEAVEAVRGLRNLMPNAVIDVRPYPGRVEVERTNVAASA